MEKTQILIEEGTSSKKLLISAEKILKNPEKFSVDSILKLELDIRNIAADQAIDDQIELIRVATKLKELRISLNSILLNHRFKTPLSDEEVNPNLKLTSVSVGELKVSILNNICSIIGMEFGLKKKGRKKLSNKIESFLRTNNTQFLENIADKKWTLFQNSVPGACLFLGKALKRFGVADKSEGKIRIISPCLLRSEHKPEINLGKYNKRKFKIGLTPLDSLPERIEEDIHKIMYIILKKINARVLFEASGI